MKTTLTTTVASLLAALALPALADDPQNQRANEVSANSKAQAADFSNVAPAREGEQPATNPTPNSLQPQTPDSSNPKASDSGVDKSSDSASGLTAPGASSGSSLGPGSNGTLRPVEQPGQPAPAK